MSPQRVHPRTCLADVRRRTGNDRYPTASTFPPETALTKFMQNLRSEEHTSELQSLMRISYAVFCLKKNTSIMQQVKSLFIVYPTIITIQHIPTASLVTTILQVTQQ